jgi:hypothetical protein
MPASLTQRECFLRGPCKVVIRKCSADRTVVVVVELSFETPACQDMSLGAKELNWAEPSELAVAE